MRNCPANPASSFGPVWKLPREGAQWRGKLLRVLLNTVGLSPSWHREGAAYGRTGTPPCPDIMSLGQTETPNSLDLAAYGRTDTSNSPDLPAYGRTVRQTYVRPAGPPCLWPDRPPALELTKLLNGGKGCSRRKHGYRKESGSRALLAFPFPLALYARVLSKPG